MRRSFRWERKTEASCRCRIGTINIHPCSKVIWTKQRPIIYSLTCNGNIFVWLHYFIDRNFFPMQTCGYISVLYFVNLFVCLGFIVPLENFSLIWRRHHCRWVLQILTYARHSWPLSSECSFIVPHLLSGGQPSLLVISEDPWYSHLLPSV